VAKPARKPRSYRTLKEFAAALDRPLTTVAGWVKHQAWRWGRKAPWAAEIVPDVLRWAADELEKGRPAKDPATLTKTQQLRDEKLRQEIRKLRANADQAETALARERGALHDAGDCAAAQNMKAALIRNSIESLDSQIVSLALSHGLPHEAAPIFQQQVKDLHATVLRFLSASTVSRPVADGDELADEPIAA
jgi:hypothetical protein